ncbi:hypothetical protein F7725_023666 [Dissostichus mawsoni]|uniref:Attractin-like protein 1 n=1 Tax=Dissostichus mawsoni TaxID=36200 RepID=A0A7J5XX78_DISMA|nr:hypothetical protein F7725_023666 [Dissostichus mawsoni]
MSGFLSDGPVNYKYKTKCTWLIEGYPNAVLRLRFNHFATECSWDHMYVYDGDSIYAPLIAVFSDAAYNLTGFSIAYSINSCPNNCSGHGRCSTANSASGRVYCECEEYWKGEACNIPYCRGNCGSPGRGYCPDCSLSVPSTEAFWVMPSVKPSAQSLGRASHQALDDIYMFGGKLESKSANVTDELWVFNIPRRTWSPRKPAPPPPFGVEGHSAHLVELRDGEQVMLVFFGYSPVYSYVNKVQEYNIRNDCVFLHGGFKALSNNKFGPVDHMYRYHVHSRTWVILRESGVSRYLHSSVLLSGTVLVFGETLTTTPRRATEQSASLQTSWRTTSLRVPPLGRVFAVNGSKKANVSPGNQNHLKSISLLLSAPKKPESTDEQCFRFSDCASCTANTRKLPVECLSAASNCTVSVKDSSSCKRREEQECFRLLNCRSCSLNTNCQWEQQQQECQALPEINCMCVLLCAGQLCGEGWHHVGEVCLRINSSSESYDNAQHYCKNLGGNIASLLTDKQVHFVLEELHKYQLQDKVGACDGYQEKPSDSGFCAYLEREAGPGLRANPCTAPTDGLICEKPAAAVTAPARPWSACGAAARSAASTPPPTPSSFPYGQCLEWQTQGCAAQNCSGVRTCAECLERTECGWCGDPSNTGRGVCMEGSYRGPLKPAVPRAGPRDRERLRDRDMVLDQSLCSSDRGFNWAFIQCPACQCNGHSRCVNGSVCEHCGNLTAGPHCQSCMPGYYGDPTNGGRCNACKCNSHANVCHVNTGKCFCTTKGIKETSANCECDSENRYLGNPLRGTYNLLIDYQFTFSLLQEDDRHYTSINFMATPEQANKNLDMSINASNNFNLNITCWHHLR